MWSWLRTWSSAEPLEVAACVAAIVFGVFAIISAVKVGRELSALLREAEERRADWCGENFGAQRW